MEELFKNIFFNIINVPGDNKFLYLSKFLRLINFPYVLRKVADNKNTYIILTTDDIRCDYMLVNNCKYIYKLDNVYINSKFEIERYFNLNSLNGKNNIKFLDFILDNSDFNSMSDIDKENFIKLSINYI